MSSEKLGRLEPYDLRKPWPNEAEDFTPWLASEDNIGLLGDVLGLELEVEGTEQQVGPFSADILCKDTVHNRYVVIENQLEKTDHTHLGQIITYAAGLDAAVIVWIAKRFSEEHRAAIDWLNNHTGEDVNFFALEIELWKISDSAPAPKFNAVCKPNEWTKANAKPSGQRSEVQRIRYEFWSAFREFLLARGYKSPGKASTSTWMPFGIGKPGVFIDAVASKWDSVEDEDVPVIRFELVLIDKNAKAYYAQLKSDEAKIEKEVGEPLVWYTKENQQSCKIFVHKRANFLDPNNWPEQHEWLWKYLQIFDDVFRPRVKELVAPTETEPA